MIEECCTAGVSNADFDKFMLGDDGGIGDDHGEDDMDKIGMAEDGSSGSIAGLSAVAMLVFDIVGAVGLL